MDETTKKYIQRGLLLGGVVLVGLFIRKKIKQGKLLKSFGNVNIISKDNLGNTFGKEDAGYDYGIKAKRLHELMDGVDWFGANENKIISLLQQLDCDGRKKVKVAFESTYADGQALDDWLAGDLGGDKLATARELMSCV